MVIYQRLNTANRLVGDKKLYLCQQSIWKAKMTPDLSKNFQLSESQFDQLINRLKQVIILFSKVYSLRTPMIASII